MGLFSKRKEQKAAEELNDYKIKTYRRIDNISKDLRGEALSARMSVARLMDKVKNANLDNGQLDGINYYLDEIQRNNNNSGAITNRVKKIINIIDGVPVSNKQTDTIIEKANESSTENISEIKKLAREISDLQEQQDELLEEKTPENVEMYSLINTQIEIKQNQINSLRRINDLNNNEFVAATMVNVNDILSKRADEYETNKDALDADASIAKLESFNKATAEADENTNKLRAASKSTTSIQDKETLFDRGRELKMKQKLQKEALDVAKENNLKEKE